MEKTLPWDHLLNISGLISLPHNKFLIPNSSCSMAEGRVSAILLNTQILLKIGKVEFYKFTTRNPHTYI